MYISYSVSDLAMPVIIILADYDVSNFAYDVFLILYAPEYPRKLGMLKQQVRCVET